MNRPTSPRASWRHLVAAVGAPTAAVSLLLLGVSLVPSSASGSAPASAPAVKRVAGRLLVAHGDNFAGHMMNMSAQVSTGTSVVPLQIQPEQHDDVMDLAGQNVVAEGTASGNGLVLQSVAPAGAPVAQASIRRIAVVLLRTKGTTTDEFPVSTAQSTFFGTGDSVASWFDEASSGAVSVTGHVYGWYTSSITSPTCSSTGTVLDNWLQEGAAKAVAAGYNAANFDNLVIYTPDIPACNFAGVAWVGSNGVLFNGYMHVGVAAHELGHNLGLWHAGSLDCNGVTLGSSCSRTDYGDPFDVMGDAYQFRTYNGSHKYALGWLPAAEVKTVPIGTTTVALTSSEVPVPGSTELIVVPLANGTKYEIERRSSHGEYDQGLSGVWVRVVEPDGGFVSSDDTTLLDMHPGTPAVDDGNLAAGQTFTDAANHVSIKTLTDSGATASLQVTRAANAPSVPYNVRVSGGNARITVRWTAPFSNGGAAINAYSIKPYRNGVAQPAIVIPASPLNHVVTGLTNGVKYSFRVAAHNSTGWSANAPTSAVLVAGAPNTPTKTKAVRTKAGALRVTFVAPNANGAPITKYTVMCTSVNGGKAGTKAANVGPVTVSGLTAGRGYTCRVAATNARGSGPKSSVSPVVKA